MPAPPTCFPASETQVKLMVRPDIAYLAGNGLICCLSVFYVFYGMPKLNWGLALPSVIFVPLVVVALPQMYQERPVCWRSREALQALVLVVQQRGRLTRAYRLVLLTSFTHGAAYSLAIVAMLLGVVIPIIRQYWH